MAASNDEIQARLLRDADSFGGRAAIEEPSHQVRAGTGVYILGFYNALLLAQEAPAVAAEVLQVLSERISSTSSEAGRGRRISANQRAWIDEWRQLLGH